MDPDKIINPHSKEIISSASITEAENENTKKALEYANISQQFSLSDIDYVFLQTP